MTTNDLRQRLMATDEYPRTALLPRRANRVIDLLRWTAFEMTDKRSRLQRAHRNSWRNALDRLDRAGITPFARPEQLADVAEALGVNADDRAALVRLVWVGNRHHAQRHVVADAAYDELLTQTQEILRRIALVGEAA